MADPSDAPKQTGAEFLLTDIAVAMTFLDVAETTSMQIYTMRRNITCLHFVPGTVRRNQHNARLAYDTVCGFLSTLTLTADDRREVEDRLGVLKTRLLAVGQQF